MQRAGNLEFFEAQGLLWGREVRQVWVSGVPVGALPQVGSSFSKLEPGVYTARRLSGGAWGGSITSGRSSCSLREPAGPPTTSPTSRSCLSPPSSLGAGAQRAQLQAVAFHVSPVLPRRARPPLPVAGSGRVAADSSPTGLSAAT